MEQIVLAQSPNTVKLMVDSLATARSRPAATAGLPARQFLLQSQLPALSRLTAYNEVCKFRLGDRVSATWLHVQTFPLQLAVMAQSDFPFILPGLVHVRNRMSLLRPLSPTDPLDIRVWADNLAPHRRGATFDLCGEISVGGQLAWTGASTYLSRASKLPGDPPSQPRIVAPDGPASQRWHLPANLGRRYAKAAGDYNPIHLNPITSKVFGFSHPIVQGMWTHARALAAFGGALPPTYDVRVSFLKPIALPGAAAFTADDGRFVVKGTDAERVYLVGELTPRPA